MSIVTSFRSAFSAFSDVNKWSDETISMALDEADAETGGKGWGSFDDIPSNFKRRGMFLYAAHWLASTYPSGETVMNGSSNFATQSKSVGDESISYNNGVIDDAWLSSSSFGQQYSRLRKRAGRAAKAV